MLHGQLRWQLAATPQPCCFHPSPAGKRLHGWEIFPLQLDDVSDLAYASGRSGEALVSAARRRMLEAPAVVSKPNADAPAFFRWGG